ncbi:DEAD/DEAH box helicase [Eubacteriales bacterium mix99]|jgi:superfamily II DNA/RNA helicase
MSSNNDFRELGLSEPILKALNGMGFEEPTEVQKKAIPHILSGEDVIVMSKTGSGKTAVFGVSLLQMTDPEKPGPQCLILEPTRELAVQVDNDLKKMASHLPHRTTAVYGQHNMNKEIQALKSPISMVTGTPGRIYDHIQHKNLITKNIRFLVLDEVDRMMDMGFIGQVRRIIRTLPPNRTTLLFSATIPGEIRRLCSAYMNHPATIEIESKTMTVDTIEQKHYRVRRNEKRTQLNRILLMERPETCMIFCNTRAAVDRVQNFLIRKGYDCRSLHGDIPQAKRMRNIQQFKRREYNILVATDVAARGIDIDNLSLVINYDVPEELDGYVHRIGRTGRAGHDGHAISLVTGEDIMTLYEIEEHIGTLIPEADLPTDQDLAKCREESHRWIQHNRIKSRPVPVSRSKGGRKKSSRNPSPQRPQRPQRPKSRQGQVHKAKETVPEKKPIENPGQGKSHPPAPDKVSEAKKPQEKPSGTLKNSAKTQQKTAEKSLLHRITGRLFGK